MAINKKVDQELFYQIKCLVKKIIMYINYFYYILLKLDE